MTSLAPHERLPEILVVPRKKTPMGAASGGLRPLVELCVEPALPFLK